MKPFNLFIGLLCLGSFTLLIPGCSHAPLKKSTVYEQAESIEVHFSPKGGCTEAVVSELTKAKHQVLVQAYSFTSAPIAKALVEAHKRGVVIKAILDKSQKSEKYSSADFLANSGILVKIDALHAIAHNKVMVIDSTVVITGSFNFTKAAEQSNAENLLIMRNRELAAKYIENWWVHEGHSETYKGKTEQ